MAMWNVHSACVKCKYRAPFCSRTTVVFIFVTAFIYIAPLIIAFKTQGFWAKEDIYREQPEVRYKYEYLFIAETDDFEHPIICTSFDILEQPVDFCPLIKVREQDIDKDGLNDIIYFDLQTVISPDLRTIKAVTLLLLFDYKLYTHSHLQMEGVGVVSEAWAEGGRSLEVTGELRLHQRVPLWARGRDSRFNSSFVDPDARDRFDLHWLLTRYATRPVTTRLENVYKTWRRGRAREDPFMVTATITYPQDTVLFRPDVWHVLKAAWVQYLALLVPFYILGGKVKKFLLDAHIVPNVKAIPWLKGNK